MAPVGPKRFERDLYEFSATPGLYGSIAWSRGFAIENGRRSGNMNVVASADRT